MSNSYKILLSKHSRHLVKCSSSIVMEKTNQETVISWCDIFLATRSRQCEARIVPRLFAQLGLSSQSVSPRLAEIPSLVNWITRSLSLALRYPISYWRRGMQPSSWWLRGNCTHITIAFLAANRVRTHSAWTGNVLTIGMMHIQPLVYSDTGERFMLGWCTHTFRSYEMSAQHSVHLANYSHYGRKQVPFARYGKPACGPWENNPKQMQALVSSGIDEASVRWES